MRSSRKDPHALIPFCTWGHTVRSYTACALGVPITGQPDNSSSSEKYQCASATVSDYSNFHLLVFGGPMDKDDAFAAVTLVAGHTHPRTGGEDQIPEQETWVWKVLAGPAAQPFTLQMGKRSHPKGACLSQRAPPISRGAHGDSVLRPKEEPLRPSRLGHTFLLEQAGSMGGHG